MLPEVAAVDGGAVYLPLAAWVRAFLELERYTAVCVGLQVMLPTETPLSKNLGSFLQVRCAHSFLDGVRYWGGLPAQHEIRSADCGWYNCTRRSDGLNTVTVVRAHVIRREGLRPCSS